MPRGPKGERHPADVIGAAILVGRIATGDAEVKRLVRWQERRKAAPDFKFLVPLRSGHPPGYRRKPIHEVDEILTECDHLAWEAMKPNTS